METCLQIGIIGNGFVGKATRSLECDGVKVLSYDINPNLCNPVGLTFNDIISSDIIFISVPTPMSGDGNLSCNLSMVEEVMNRLKSSDYSGFIVLRSTVPVGTCKKLGCYFMPEFLTEKNYIEDFINNKTWILGIAEGGAKNEEFKSVITRLFQTAFEAGKIKSSRVEFLTTGEAEMVKMFRNTFLAMKLSFCNEIYDYCQAKGVDYDRMINIAAEDDRITKSHIKVPGGDGLRGFGGTCFPKDTSSLVYEMAKTGTKSRILEAVLERNLIDRLL